MGAEIKKKRPVVIVSSNSIGKLPLRVVVPLTDWKNHYQQAPWMVKIVPSSTNGLSKISKQTLFKFGRFQQLASFKKSVSFH